MFGLFLNSERYVLVLQRHAAFLFMIVIDKVLVKKQKKKKLRFLYTYTFSGRKLYLVSILLQALSKNSMRKI